MKINRSSLIVLIIILLILIFFFPLLGAKLAVALRGGGAARNEDKNLSSENEVLQARLAVLQKVSDEMPAKKQVGIAAMVYSHYPFNFKNEILVDAGAADGVKEGSAVLFQGIFIGEIEKTFSREALVQTVFDGRMKLPVRIGGKGYDGLLTGGVSPAVHSIAKDAPVKPGDIVYTSASGIQYGLPVGAVSSTSTSPDDLFETAALQLNYDVNAIQAVTILQ